MEQLADILGQGGRSIGVDLPHEALEALSIYLGLLEKWNSKLNLVGPGSAATWAVRHVIDSLAPLEWVRDHGSLMDLGSGAGLPGVPLAVAVPSARFLLVEPRANRVAFLRNVAATLKLANVRIKEARAEDVSEKGALITGRAVAPPEAFARLASGVAEPGARLILFTQAEPPEHLGSVAARLEWRPYTAGSEPRRAVGLYHLNRPGGDEEDVPRGTLIS